MWNSGDVTYGIKAQVQTLGMKWLTARKKKVNRKYGYSLIILNVVLHNIFWIRFVGMEGLEEYAKERSPLNDQNNSGKEPAKEDITNNSYELWKQLRI